MFEANIMQTCLAGNLMTDISLHFLVSCIDCRVHHWCGSPDPKVHNWYRCSFTCGSGLCFFFGVYIISFFFIGFLVSK
jgi:hypothetical protein